MDTIGCVHFILIHFRHIQHFIQVPNKFFLIVQMDMVVTF
jgi:hypothetical protein